MGSYLNLINDNLLNNTEWHGLMFSLECVNTLEEQYLNGCDQMYIIPKVMRKIIGWPAVKNTVMSKHTKVDMFSTVTNSCIGRYSYIGEHTSVFNTTIGVGCSISSYCSIGGGSHPLYWVSTSPIFNNSVSILHYRMANTQYEPFKETKMYVKKILQNYEIYKELY